MFQREVVETIKTPMLCSVTFSQKSHHLGDNTEECSRVREVRGYSMVWHMHLCYMYIASLVKKEKRNFAVSLCILSPGTECL